MTAGSDSSLLGLAGKHALVVGGGYGMGRETALLLARAGARVAVADVDASRADAVRAELAELGTHSLGLSADVTDRRQAERLVADTTAAFGSLDAVVNIVGSASYAPLFSIDDELWEAQQAVNLRHHLNVGRAAARTMIDHGTKGAIAMVASVSGIYAAPLHGAYGAAKAAVMSLVRTMSQEWGPYGIRVNAVAPDGIATPRVRANFAARSADMAHLAADTSLKRTGEAREVAGVLAFLVSDLASFVTGQTIIVDGGVHAALPHKMDPFEQV